jgi:hypothetical protein
MSTIDYKNIDEWLFNFFEGNLSPPERESLTVFLNKHPALKADYDAWKNSYVEEPTMVYPNMDALLKPQLSTGIKWTKWAVALFIGLSSLVMYIMSEDTLMQPTASPEREKSCTDAERKATDPVQLFKTDKEKGSPQVEIVHMQTHSSGKKMIQAQSQSDDKEKLKPFVMNVQSFSGSIGDPPSDSLEIVVKKREPLSKPKDSSKSKKKKKETETIRLTNTGF